MSGHFCFCVTKTSQRRQNGVVAHRSISIARAGKDEPTFTREWLQLVQDRDRLGCKWNDVWCVLFHAHGGNSPLRLFEVYFRPFSFAKFASSNEHERRKFERALSDKRSLVAIDCTHQCANRLGFCDRCVMLLFDRWKCTA